MMRSTASWILKISVTMVAATACRCTAGTVYGGDGVPAPTVEEPPARTNQNPLEIRGTTAADIPVFIQREGEPDAQEATSGGDGTTWSHQLLLNEGDNSFVVFAAVSGEFSNTVGPFAVLVDTVPPVDPTVDPPPLPIPLAPGTPSIDYELTGTKGGDGDLMINGERWVPIDGKTRWSATLPLSLGRNELSLVSKDDLGNASGSVDIALFATDVATPTVDPVETPTRITPLTLSGTKAADTGIWVRRARDMIDGAANGVEVYARDDQSIWSTTWDLIEGDNVFYVYALDGSNRPSAELGPISVVLDTTAPPAPTLDPTPATTTGSTLRVTGQKGMDGNLCLRLNGAAACISVVGLDGQDTFGVDVALAPGINELCFSSQDQAGNTSNEVCVTVTYSQPPTVLFIDPPDRGVVTSATFSVELMVLTSGDQVASVEICHQAACSSATQSGTPGIWLGSSTLSNSTNSDGYEIEANATNSSNLTGQTSIRVQYIDGAFVISDNAIDESSSSPRITVDLVGDLHTVWNDNCWAVACDVGASATLPWDIFYRRWDGSTWAPIVRLSDVSGEANGRKPDIAADTQGNVHVVWQDDGDINGSGIDVDVIHRVISAVTLQPGAATVVTAGSSVDDVKPRLSASPDGTVHLVWERVVTSSNHDIYHVVWDGVSWGVPRLISDDADDGNSRNPDVATDGNGNAYVVWQDNGDIGSGGTDEDIYVRAVSGGSMGAITLVTDHGSDGNSLLPAVAVASDGAAHIVWHDDGAIPPGGADWDIWHRRYDPAASPASRLSPYHLVSSAAADGWSDSASIGIDLANDNIYVAWTDDGDIGGSGADFDILLATSLDGFFGAPTLLSPSASSNSFTPYITVVPGQNVYAVWKDQTDLASNGADWDVFFGALRVQ